MCSARNYLEEDNTVSLILFIDGVTYTKSVSNQMWAIFSGLVELPSILRSAYENIIFHSLWSGPDLDFNKFLTEFNSEIDDLLTNGFLFNGLDLTILLHVFLADSPGRSKVLYSHQFNGKFGCIKCLHPTTHPSHTTIYPFLNNIKDRTHADYVKSAQTAANSHRVVDGIKGLSN